MVRALQSALAAVLAAWVTALACAQSPAPGKAELSAWAKGNRILLGVTQERTGFSAQWRFQRSAHGDIVLDLEETRAGQPRAGALMLVSNAVLLARDVPLQSGRELDGFNGPLLMLQLVLRLLERAAPGGPAAIGQDKVIELTEAKRPIKVSGIGADGEFFAPWRAKGKVGRAGDGQVRFELEFESASRSGNGAAYQTHIAGIWQDASPPVQLDDSMPLRGWRGFRLKSVVVAKGSGNDVGVGTSPAMAFANLGEVRRRAAEWTDEGARRSRWQCS